MEILWCTKAPRADIYSHFGSALRTTAGRVTRRSRRAGPMCPAAMYALLPAGHAGPALQGAAVAWGGQGRSPLHFLCGTSYPKGICSAALHCRTLSPTKSQGVRRMGRRGRRPLRNRKECAEWNVGDAVSYKIARSALQKGRTGVRPLHSILYMTALSATMRCKNTAPACPAPHGHR